MVKKIKRKVAKSKSNKLEEKESAVEEETPAVVPPPKLSEALKKEVKEHAESGVSDRFSQTAENLLLYLADNWLMLVLLIGVGIGLYGFIQFSDARTQAGFSVERQTLTDTYMKYQGQLNIQHNYLKKQAEWYAENSDALTSPNFGDSPSKDDLKTSAQSFKQIQGQLSGEGAVALAQIGQASALFDTATTAEEYVIAAQLYAQVGAHPKVEPFAKSIALQNAAVAYEQAAGVSQKTSAKQHWTSAAKAWASLAEVDRDVFGLFSTIKQSRALRHAENKEGALKVLSELERAYESTLKEPKNKRWQNDIKLERALLK